jgi:hypothetical protein
MAVNKLFVEGELDSEWLNVLLGGTPGIEIGGSKSELPHLVRRDKNKYSWFLRDDSPGNEPTRMQNFRGNDLRGYRWRRHELENYLIDPVLVEVALGVARPETEAAIQGAAEKVRNYEAARWVLGQTRAGLPHQGMLATRYAGTGDYQLPGDLGEVGMCDWLKNQTAPIREQTAVLLDEAATLHRFAEFQSKLDGLDVAGVLVWYSGKDLLAAMIPFFESKIPSCKQPDDVLRKLADWRGRPSSLEGLFPEWDMLKALLLAL